MRMETAKSKAHLVYAHFTLSMLVEEPLVNTPARGVGRPCLLSRTEEIVIE